MVEIMEEQKMEHVITLTNEEYAEFIDLRVKTNILKRRYKKALEKEYCKSLDCEEISEVMEWDEVE